MSKEPSDRFYLYMALALSVTAFGGFTVTYFGPLAQGAYPEVSPTVHVHGWTFFLWYLLLPLQAGLIRSRKLSIHRRLGSASVALAAAMIVTGLVVVGVQIDLASQSDGFGFWSFMGPAIFGTLVLFTVFYAAALYYKKQPAYHRRFMVLASAGALGAATFRVLAGVFGFEALWVPVVGIFLPNLFILAAIARDYRVGVGFHPAYRTGLPVSVGVVGGLLILTMSPAAGLASVPLAAVGRALSFLY